jgi:tetratricopeptide (TPR) repeat protein/mono/diheme cytochrome c family protein
MPSIRAVRYDIGNVRSLLFGVFLIAALPPHAAAQAFVTFTKDAAPILFANCVSCHRAGEIGGFSLLTYQDARPWASAIARAVRTRAMPPWKPEPGYGGELVGARRLSAAQIATLEQWVAAGAVEGDPADLPPAPAFPDGWRLGEPDLVVTMAETYALPADGPDVLRNFVIPLPISEARYVAALEFRPGNARVVHHANMRIDRTRASRRLDAADPLPGYNGLITTGAFPEGHFLGWTPGQLPPRLGDVAWRLDPDSDLVLQLHLQPSGRGEVVQASIGLFFTDKAPARTPLMLRLGRHDIDIPAGARNYTIRDSYVLPVPVDVSAVQPHAHFRAKEIKGFAILPDGSKRWLLYIKDWDFYWQDAYRYAEPFTLPGGTTVAMEYTYDNSTANPRNPDRPARRVRWGENSTDEMGNLWIQVLPRTDDDRRVLAAAFGPKVMADDAAGYEKMLEVDPNNGRLHEAVAAIDLALGRTAEAVRHLTAALRIDPQSLEAHYNLATAYAWQGRRAESITHFERALQIDPTHVAAHANLGAVLRSERRLEPAVVHLRRALQLDPMNPTAHTNLAGILSAQGDTREAVAHYRAALQSNPDLLEALTDLSWILATSPDPATRAPADALRLAERAAALTKRRDVRALETLAAAHAALGQLEQAVAAQQAAIALAGAAGNAKLAAQLRERLALYRK